MSKTSRTVVSMPKTAVKGEIVPIRVIVQHDMESGFRHTERGVRVPRDIIRNFVCTYEGSPTAHREAETAKAHRG